LQSGTKNLKMKKQFFCLALFFIGMMASTQITAQIIIDAPGTRIGDIGASPALTAPYVSTPNQTGSGNYWPIWMTKGIHFWPQPAQSGMMMENYTNSIGLANGNVATVAMCTTSTNPLVLAPCIYEEPLLRGAWGNTAWLGNAAFKFWQVHATEIWAYGAFINSSDRRFKTNIKVETGALSKVMLLKPVIYDKLDINENTPEEKKAILNERTKNQHGLIAQEVMEVFPELVVQNEEGYYGVKYQELISILIKAMQEQQAEIDSLKINLKD
jgi:hypothetical protein